MKEFIHDMPKAELHIHIEGSLEPELMFEIGARNGIELSYDSIEDIRKAYEFADLQSFLEIYYEGTRVLRLEPDFYDMTFSYMEKIHRQNVRHTEIFFDPQTHTDRGIPFETLITGIHNALVDAKEQLGISSKLIMCFLRHLSAEAAMKTLEQAIPFKEWIIGIGLDSSEVGHPPRKFKAVFDRALGEGFLTVAHAGEEGPPDYIWEALEILRVSRIDHGVHCIEDKLLLEKLKAEQIPLTICPLSNIKLCVFDNITDHNLKQLLDMGLCVTVNSDDPAYFGGYIDDNYLAAQKAFNLGRDDIYQLAKNAFNASFLDQGAKQILLDELDDYMAKTINK
jgi:adenosine deaminase